DANAQPADAAAERCEIVGHRRVERRRIGRVLARDYAENRGGVGGAAGHWPDMIERVGKRKDAVTADAAPGRFDAGETAAGRWEADRSAGIRSKRAVAEAGGC